MELFAYDALLTTNGRAPQPGAPVRFYNEDDTSYSTPLDVFAMDGRPIGSAPVADAYGYINNAGGFKLPARSAVAKSGTLPAIPIYAVRTILANSDAAAASAKAAQAVVEEARGVATAAATAALEVQAKAEAGAFDGAPGKDSTVPGPPGVNAVPTAEAVAAYASTPGNPVKAALEASFDAKQAAPTVTKATGIYDRRLNIYNLKPAHLRRARAALGKAFSGNGYASLTFVGESTMTGAGTTNVGRDSWPAQLRSLLAKAGASSAGTGLVAAFTNAGSAENRWSLASGWTPWDGYSNTIVNTANADPAVFTSDVAGTVVRVVHGTGTDAYTISIDGAAPVTVTPPAVSEGNPIGKPAVYTVTGLPNTTHTVAIASKGVGRYSMIFGAEVRSGSGVVLNNLAVGGQGVIIAGNTSNAHYPSQLAVSAALNSDLIFLGYEINDIANGTPVATYKANTQKAITTLRSSGADLVLMASTPGDWLNTIPYTAALYELADSNDLPLIDLQDRWKDYATANKNGLMADGWHPNAAGYGDISRAVFNALAL